MSYEYSENILVQENAGKLLQDELGWEVKFAYDTEVLGEDGTFGRKSYREVLLTRYFRQSLRKLNPWLTDTQVLEAEKKLQDYLASSSLMQINEEKYKLLRDGIPVTNRLPGGRIEQKTALVFDFQNPENNHFLAIKELKIHSPLYRRRTDIVGFVNGVPLVFMEFKKTTVDVQDAYTKNYKDYLDTIPHLFHYNAFLILSNGPEAKVGTLGSDYEFFHEWKRLNEEENGNVELQTMLYGMCRKETLLDLFENFILFDHSEGKSIKIVAKNHQYLGVNNAFLSYTERVERKGKLGVYWHTQGAGKSYSMVFLAQKIHRKAPGSPTILVLTDRDELNTQISDTFANCGLLGSLKASQFIASSRRDLFEKLHGNPSFVFSLIQKFYTQDISDSELDTLCRMTQGHDILIMSDEAHRTQYGIFADNMNKMLPNASKIGFTGTPLLADDEITKRTFGGYISIYDFKRAIEDKVTVPLFYENRGERIKELEDPAINQQILDAIAEAEDDPEKLEKLEKDFEKEIHLLIAESRLDLIAKDFVDHYTAVWTTGKAMFVCLNKVACVRMYNLVQKHWQNAIRALQEEIQGASEEDVPGLTKKLKWMKETEMAVVISQEQNEIQTFQKWGLDILPHRTKMEKRKLDKEFKKAENPFRIVFVCAMWLTGFDVKSLSCLYLDKPLKAHTLMQTIARANRVATGKTNGLIVDYIGVVKALRKALADYTQRGGAGGEDPTIDKDVLLQKISELVAAADEHLAKNGFNLETLVKANGFNKIEKLKEAADTLCKAEKVKKTHIIIGDKLERLSRYIDRRDLASDIVHQRDAIIEINRMLHRKKKHVDCTDIIVAVNRIVNEHVEMQAAPGTTPSRQFDISRIDFDLLRKEFNKKKHKNLIIEDLAELIKRKLEAIPPTGKHKADYFERYQEIISAYNNEQHRASIEKTFMDLMHLAEELDEEQKRYVREGFSSPEELAIYDLIFKDDLSAKEIQTLKDVAKELLVKIKEKIAELDHWRDKPETQAMVETLIRDTLYRDLPQSYDDASIATYRDNIYAFVYSRYPSVAG